MHLVGLIYEIGNWVGHILRRNGLLKHVLEGKCKKDGSEGKNLRRPKQLPDYPKENERIR